jgi:electron transport complex protein RnfB
MDVDNLIKAIDDLLPQTQCRKCGFGGCYPYAEAIALGKADIYQCPPGGMALVQRLGTLLGVRVELQQVPPAHPKTVAFIHEPRCIGCALCLKACPVDAIVGAVRFMHTVIADQCTGCELCVPTCPVDCIEMRGLPATQSSWEEEKLIAQQARGRYSNKKARLMRDEKERCAQHAKRSPEMTAPGGLPQDAEERRAFVAAAVARAKTKWSAKKRNIP